MHAYFVRVSAAILDSVTLEDWGEEIQDGGIEPIYLAFRIPLRNNACTAGYMSVWSITV